MNAPQLTTSSELVLLGLAHWDLFISQRIHSCFDCLKPDIITYENNEEDENTFNDRTAEARARFHQALSASSLTLDQRQVLLATFFSQDERLEQVAVKEYAAKAGVPIHFVDEPDPEETRFLILYVNDHYGSMIRFLKEGFIPGSLVDKVQKNVISIGLEATLQSQSKVYDSKYQDYALHFLGQELNTKQVKVYSDGVLAGQVGDRDLKMSQRIKEAMVAGKRLVHIGGAGHFVDQPLTLYQHLREYNPQRLVIHPEWFERGLGKRSF